MLYIDFDGVILDTEPLLFEEWRRNPNRHLLPNEEKIKYVQRADWEYIINNSSVINDSIYYLKEMDPTKTAILTKIHSMENEGVAKIKWRNKNNIKQPIILVPYPVNKSDMVDARGNILIDDGLKNLDTWKNNGGIPILFDINNDNLDSWNQPNINNYEKVLSLSKFK